MRKLLKICISILLLIVFIQVLKPNNYDIVLGCGLFAFIGNKSSQFDWMSFNILGVYNDVRGKDSCGRVVNNTIEKGIKRLSEYEDFVEEIANPNESLTKIVLGHTRKASVGETSIINAQPIVFKKSSPIVQRIAKKDKKYDKWLKTLKHNSIVFAGIHNGTIHNYKQLAADYKLSLVINKDEVKTDSMILFEILIQNKFQMLTEYTGTAALIFHNYYDNCVYTFKGASALYSKNNSYEEKPLYRWKQPIGGYYFSSLESSLKFIGGKAEDIIDLPTNELTKFKNGVIVDTQEIDRTKSRQKETTTSKYETFDDDNYQTKVMGFRNSHSIPTAQTLLNSNDASLLFFPDEQNKEWQDEIVPINYLNKRDSTPAKRLIYQKGRYWIDNILAQGLVVTNEFGWIHLREEDIKIAAAVNYFVDGILMDDDASFYEALGLRLKSKFPEHTDTVKRLVKLSRYPICPLDKTINELEDTYSPYGSKFNGYYSGIITPRYAKRRYTFNSGNLEIIDELSSITAGSALTQKVLILVLLKDYQKHFQQKLAKFIAVKECESSDSLNRVLISILKSGGYLISTKLVNQTEEVLNYPEIDFKALKRALKNTRKVDIPGLLGEYNPCFYCDYTAKTSTEEICKHCPIKKKYTDICTEYKQPIMSIVKKTLSTPVSIINNSSEELAIEKQLTTEAITGLSSKLLESVENTESELFTLGNTDLTTKFADTMNEIKNTLLKFDTK